MPEGQPDRVDLALKLDRANLRIAELKNALVNVANVLGPQKTCGCHAADCALDLEAFEALRITRAALDGAGEPEPIQPPEQPKEVEVVDLAAALRASVEAAKKRREEAEQARLKAALGGADR